jgi:hypothetical protein
MDITTTHSSEDVQIEAPEKTPYSNATIAPNAIICVHFNHQICFRLSQSISMKFPDSLRSLWRFPKMGVPLIIHFNNGNFHYKPTNFGIPHLWNPPYNINLRLATEPKRESSLSSTRRSGIRKSRQRVYACVLCTSRKSIAACALRMLPVHFLRLIQYLGS